MSDHDLAGDRIGRTLRYGGTGIIVTRLAYHGITETVSGISPSLGANSPLGPHVYLVDAPLRPVQAGAAEKVGPRFADGVRTALAQMEADGVKPAALIFDAIFSIESERLQDNSLKTGRMIQDGLRDLASRYPIISDVRGAGLFIGVEIAKNADGFPEIVDGSGGSRPEVDLELGECHLDRIVVGAVGRQQQKPCALCADCVLGRFALMAGEIVAVDDVTWMKGRYELGFDVGLEYCAAHRCINDPGGQRDRRA